MGHSVLILDDNEVDARLMKEYLQRSGKSFGKIQTVQKKESYQQALKEEEWDLIISDYRLLSWDAFDAIKIKNDSYKEVPLIIVSGTIGEEKAVELIKDGAVDFLLKDNAKERLPQMAWRAINESLEKQKRQKAEKEVKQREQLLQAMMDQAPSAIYVMEQDGTFRFVNEKFKELIGQEESELIGNKAGEYVNPEIFDKVRVKESQAIESGEIVDFEQTLKLRGEKRTFWISKVPLKKVPGLETCICTIITDVTERKETENRLRESVREKEILLQEIHHRVKNNLAIVSSMLQLQAFDSNDEEVNAALMNSQGRIQSISIIHELLYQSDSFSEIDLKEDASKLVEHITSSLQMDCDVDLEHDLQGISLNINQAIPCALLINELLTNIYKHAFVGRDKGKIELSLKEENQQVHLMIADNGIGLPDDFSLENPESLGAKLITVLVKQLNGDLSYTTEKGRGTRFSIQFQKQSIKGSASSLLDYK